MLPKLVQEKLTLALKTFKNYEEYDISSLQKLKSDFIQLKQKIKEHRNWETIFMVQKIVEEDLALFNSQEIINEKININQFNNQEKYINNFIKRINYRIKVLRMNYNQIELKAIEDLLLKSIQDNELQMLKNALHTNPIDLNKTNNCFLNFVIGLQTNNIFKIDALNLLIDYVANVNMWRSNNDLPINKAIEENNIELVELLIRAGANINLQGSYGYAPLHIAVQKSNIEITQLLISEGANIEVKDKYNKTALYLVVKYKTVNSIAIASLLIKAGASTNFQNSNNFLSFNLISEQQNKIDFSLIHLVAKQGDIEMMQLLIDNGMEVNIKDKDNDTPIFWAIKYNNINCNAIIELLISLGANINEQDNNGNTILHWAIIKRNKKLVNYLISNFYYDLSIKNNAGFTILQLAIHKNEWHIIWTLILQLMAKRMMNVKQYVSFKKIKEDRN